MSWVRTSVLRCASSSNWSVRARTQATDPCGSTGDTRERGAFYSRPVVAVCQLAEQPVDRSASRARRQLNTRRCYPGRDLNGWFVSVSRCARSYAVRQSG